MIRVGDLSRAPLANEVLHCMVCGADFSANAMDYFAADPKTTMVCTNDHRRTPLRIAFKRVVYDTIAAPTTAHGTEYQG